MTQNHPNILPQNLPDTEKSWGEERNFIEYTDNLPKMEKTTKVMIIIYDQLSLE